MSTVPEALAAASCGMQVLALSIVTNVAKPDVLEATNHHKVVNVAGQAAWKLRTIVSETLIQRFNSNDT
jgi:purine-nucleoside phosphorylase